MYTTTEGQEVFLTVTLSSPATQDVSVVLTTRDITAEGIHYRSCIPWKSALERWLGIVNRASRIKNKFDIVVVAHNYNYFPSCQHLATTLW